MKALEWSQHYTSIFRRSSAANSVAGDGIWMKFKLIQAFMSFFVTCKNDEDPIKMKALEGSQQFPNYMSMGILQTQTVNDR